MTGSQGFVRERFRKEFFDLLNKEDAREVPKILYAMATKMERGLFWDPVKLLRLILENRDTLKERLDTHDIAGHAVVKRVAITPTRLLFFQPDLMQVGDCLTFTCTLAVLSGFVALTLFRQQWMLILVLTGRYEAYCFQKLIKHNPDYMKTLQNSSIVTLARLCGLCNANTQLCSIITVFAWEELALLQALCPYVVISRYGPCILRLS